MKLGDAHFKCLHKNFDLIDTAQFDDLLNF